MREQICLAYERALPSQAETAALYARILDTAEQRASNKRRPVLTRLLLAAAILALLAGLTTVGYAAYQKWMLPKPALYTPAEDGGIYEIHTNAVYDSTDDAPGQDSTGTDAEPLSDRQLIRRALEIWSMVSNESLSPASMTVTRQKNLYWDREEAEVSFSLQGSPASVKFDAQTGVFIGMSGIRWVLSDAAACQSPEQADELAQRYYESLPVVQGYVMRHREVYDEQFWSYDFCAEVAPELYSPYECVRVCINPASGELAACTVFYVPLLDDHRPEDEALTQEQAQAAALACPELELDGYRLREAEITVGLPNWSFTPYEAVNAKISGVTRLCWALTYERPESEFADEILILVDLYTGEILGGDRTG